MGVKRYANVPSEVVTMVEASDGCWIKHSDYVDALSKVMLFYSLSSEERENGDWKDLYKEISDGKDNVSEFED